MSFFTGYFQLDDSAGLNSTPEILFITSFLRYIQHQKRKIQPSSYMPVNEASRKCWATTS